MGKLAENQRDPFLVQSSQVQKGESKNSVLGRAETAPRTVKEQNPQKDKERVGN